MTYIKYYNYKEVYGPSKLRVNKIVELVGDVCNKKILDIGCGDGTLGLALKKKGAYVVGCDISKKAIYLCKDKLDECFFFDVEKDNFNRLDKDFNIIIASEIIEHLFDPEKFLLNIKEIMTSETDFILTTPNFLVWTNRLRILFGKFEYTKIGLLDESHLRFFSYNSLKRTIEKLDLKVVEENSIVHSKIPYLLGRKFPNLFCFQMIFKIKLP